jgi:3',5'-cyclic-AMP phosphodiesterase
MISGGVGNVKRNFTRFFLIVCTFIGACDQPFSYSPFQVDVPQSIRNTTQVNLERIAAIDTVSNDTFRVALIADTHYHFEALKDALNHINRRNDLTFIIVAGDISENGLQKEFELFHSIMSSSKLPYLTVIGNHDYLANGSEVYRQLYGPLNYSFEFHRVRFVMWDNIRWESGKEPDWQWFKDALSAASEKNAGEPTQLIPFSHIPPSDPQVKDSEDVYTNLISAHHVKTSIHGHTHEFSQIQSEENEIHYITIGSPQKRAYAVLTIMPDRSEVTQVKY